MSNAGILVTAALCLAWTANASGQDIALWQKQVEEAKKASQQKDYAHSEQLLHDALREAQKFGPEDAHVGLTLHNLANLAAVRGQYAAAEPLYKQALAILEKAHGSEHSQVAIVLLGLADLYAAQGKGVEAEPYYQRCLVVFSRTAGKDHPIIATVLERYAVLLRKTDRAAEAAQQEARARTIRAKQTAAK